MIWVAVQAVLFALILFLPLEKDFGLPSGLRDALVAVAGLGFIILLRAVYDLRRSLSVAPTPVEHGRLQTKGIYGYIRHPMYVSVWLILGPGVLRSESYIKLGLMVILIIFFVLKTHHEEKLLLQKYPDYKTYMKRVGAYVPKLK